MESKEPRPQDLRIELFRRRELAEKKYSKWIRSLTSSYIPNDKFESMKKRELRRIANESGLLFKYVTDMFPS